MIGALFNQLSIQISPFSYLFRTKIRRKWIQITCNAIAIIQAIHFKSYCTVKNLKLNNKSNRVVRPPLLDFQRAIEPTICQKGWLIGQNGWFPSRPQFFDNFVYQTQLYSFDGLYIFPSLKFLQKDYEISFVDKPHLKIPGSSLLHCL